MNMAVEMAKENRAGLDQPENRKAGLFDMLSVWATCYRDLCTGPGGRRFSEDLS